MLQQRLEQVLADVDAETVAEWYAQLNCFGTPAFLPVRLRAVHDKKRAMRDRKRRALMRAIEATLGPRGTSRAWWLYGLRRSEDEWLLWWNVERAKAEAVLGIVHDGHHWAANARNQRRAQRVRWIELLGTKPQYTCADASIMNSAWFALHHASSSLRNVGHKSLAQLGHLRCHSTSVGKYAESTPIGSSNVKEPPGPVQTSSSFHFG